MEGVEREEPEAQVSVRILVRCSCPRAALASPMIFFWALSLLARAVGVWRRLPELLSL